MKLPAPTAIPVFLLVAAAWTVLMPDKANGLPRIWTSKDGRELVGEFVKSDAKMVTVSRDNGKIVSIPLDMLNPDDLKYISSQIAENEAAKKAAEEKAAQDAEALIKGKGAITYKLSDGSEKWPEERRNRIVAAMEESIAFLNKNGSFKKAVIANNSPGTPTADANINGWINWGGSISRRVAIHEIAHTLGIGTHENWGKNIKDGKWIGKFGIAQIQEFDGKDAVLHADRMHFWPYGLNQDSESSKENDLRHIKMVEAMRKDMGAR
ncbi:MAG: hypothetical protein V4584_07170 [Verrucomicrobiota bacterium]